MDTKWPRGTSPKNPQEVPLPYGDIDHSNSVNAVDIQLAVNAVLGLAVGAYDTDVNDDGATNAIDIQFVVNAVLGRS